MDCVDNLEPKTNISKINKNKQTWSILCQTIIISLNTLYPKDAKCQERFGSLLVQVMACCLMTPSHYLSQSWFMVYEAQRNLPKCDNYENVRDLRHKFKVENDIQ